MTAAGSYKSLQTFGIPRLFAKIVQDATSYFLVIICVHVAVTIYTSRIPDVSPSHYRTRTAS